MQVEKTAELDCVMCGECILSLLTKRFGITALQARTFSSDMWEMLLQILVCSYYIVSTDK
jgi:hypothetical protein